LGSLPRETFWPQARIELGWNRQELLTHRDHEVGQLLYSQFPLNQFVTDKSQVHGFPFEFEVQNLVAFAQVFQVDSAESADS
jgi:hypothetical protein